MLTNVQRTPQNQQAILDQVNHLAWLLDNSIRIPIINYRIGLDAIVGLVPGLGDIAGLVVSSYIVLQAMRLGAPRTTLVRMVSNIAIEALVGLIPFLGDFFDATFKANARNVRLLNEVFGQPTSARIARRTPSKGAVAAVIGILLGLLALIGTAGVLVFQAILRLFYET